MYFADETIDIPASIVKSLHNNDIIYALCEYMTKYDFHFDVSNDGLKIHLVGMDAGIVAELITGGFPAQ